MLNNFIKICKIFPYTEEDANILYSTYSDSAVDIIETQEINNLNVMPSLIVGWEKVKELFPDQSIREKKINDNVYWTYSSAENKKEFKEDVRKFIEDSIKNFFPKKITTYDAIIDGSLKDFIAKNIDSKNRSFIYFHKNACYIHNGNKTCAISLISLEYVGKDFKKTITSLINKVECTIFSYYNCAKYTYHDDLRDVMTTENNFWVKYSHHIEPRQFSEVFLGKDIHKHIPLLMKIITDNNPVDNDELNSCKRQAKKDRVTTWLSTSKIYFDKYFKIPNGVKGKRDGDNKYLIVRYSDKRTITGRINCIDSFNPQILPKDSPIRKQMVSRFKGGRIAVFDYKSFETRLSMYLSRNEEFILKNMNSDLHMNTAKEIFEVENPTNEERVLAKRMNHTMLYGGGDKLLKDMLSEAGVEDEERSLKNVKEFLEPILDVSSYINDVYKELGYIINPFGTLIKPNKSYAAFNNYVQGTAADIVVDKLFEMKDWLKNKKSKFMFQVYDSFIFDISPEDENAINEIEIILSKYNDMVFDVEVTSGLNYMDLS